jgi:hypothetical protein
MSTTSAVLPPDGRLAFWALGVALAVTTSTTAAGQASRRAAPARRGAPGAARGPLTHVTVSLGSRQYDAEVDADCQVDERATVGGPRAYFVANYPWFGQRVAADQPQWRVNLGINRAGSPGAYDQFVFSFMDGSTSATIQTVGGSPRMGSGTVRVTRHGDGARFDVTGRSKEGEAVRATIDCSAFQKSEGSGG